MIGCYNRNTNFDKRVRANFIADLHAFFRRSSYECDYSPPNLLGALVAEGQCAVLYVLAI